MTRSIIFTIRGAFDNLNEYEEVRTESLIAILSKQGSGKSTNDYVIAVKKESDGSKTYIKYFYNEKGKLQYEECDIRITIKEKLKNRKKTFSQREKLDLLLEYISINKRMPESKTIYKQCPIGKFMNDADKWSEICETISEAKKH